MSTSTWSTAAASDLPPDQDSELQDYLASIALSDADLARCMEVPSPSRKPLHCGLNMPSPPPPATTAVPKGFGFTFTPFTPAPYTPALSTKPCLPSLSKSATLSSLPRTTSTPLSYLPTTTHVQPMPRHPSDPPDGCPDYVVDEGWW